MAKKSSKDYFGLGYLVSVILAIIPITSWLCGAITRFKEGKLVAGILRLVFGFNIVLILTPRGYAPTKKANQPLVCFLFYIRKISITKRPR